VGNNELTFPENFYQLFAKKIEVIEPSTVVTRPPALLNLNTAAVTLKATAKPSPHRQTN
jgi:hypothetical protein